MTNHRILFVGLNTIDLMFLLPSYPPSNTKTKAMRHQVAVGGPASNAAVTAAYLGAEVDLVTPIGEHPLAAYVRDDLQRQRVRVLDPAANREWAPVFASIVTTAQRGERTVFSYHPAEKLPPSEAMSLDCAPYRVALFDGFHLEAAIPIAKRCRAAGVRTILDGGSWKAHLEALLPHIDVAVCSADFTVPNGTGSDAVFGRLRRHGVSMAAITRGERSILFWTGDSVGEVPVPTVETVDTLGAGDVFHGAVAFYLARGLAFDAALAEAATVAARSCSSFGTRDWMVGTWGGMGAEEERGGR